MKYVKKNLKIIIPTVILIVGIIFSFFNFIHNNSVRIANQNEEYISDLTKQRAISIDTLISENLTYIKSTAYLYGKNLDSVWANVAVIRDYEENSVFDRLRFIDASGDDYTSQGVMANLYHREYFQDGMKGNSGITYVPESKVTGERQVGFYAPVYFEDEIIGVMVGFYGELYVQRLLEYSIFGYEGEGWLCLRDGTVIGSTLPEVPENYLTYLEDTGRCSAEELNRLSGSLARGEDIAFTYTEDGMQASGYAVNLTQEDWVLIRSFPPYASDQILTNANGEGERLIFTLIALFAAYILVVVLTMLFNQKRMKEANRNANDVSTGVSMLFDKFVTIDLTTEQYNYIGGAPSDDGLPISGTYADFYNMVLGRIPDAKQKQEAEDTISLTALARHLKDTDRISIRVHAPIGREEWYTFNFIVLSREGGEPRRVLLVCQDVTDLYHKEEQEQQRLLDALNAAETASLAKTEFLFNMSHDLRTPMNAIIGYTELALRENVTENEIRQYIRKIDSSSLHLLALINDILEMSRIESGKMQLDPAPANLVATMEEAREMFETQMAEKNIAFTVDCGNVKNRWVLCDKNRFNRILLNLLSNAYKFTPAGGAVSVMMKETGCDGERADYEIRVKDNGIGMSREFVSKLFTPFERERTSTVSGIQGTGLGLSITKSIVDLMDGSIDVVTEQGEGTEFIIRVTFALSENADEQRNEADAATTPTDFSGYRLLIVEDNEINREIATMILLQNGFVLETAENGRIALDMVSGSEPGYYDAILMDIQMPVMNGYEAAKAIRALDDKRLADIPIIAMTANAFKEDIRTALDAGMNGHISKPIDVKAMLATLMKWLPKKPPHNG